MKKIIIFILCLVATFFVSNLTEISGKQGTYSRAPSSLSKSSIHSHIFSQNNTSLLRTEKLLAPISIQLDLEGLAPKKSGDEFTLKALIKSRYDLQALKVEWILPVGVELVSGSMTDSLNSLVAGEVREVQAIFLQNSEFNEQIHMRVKSHDARLPFGASAQFNTLDQNSIDESVIALERRAREYMKSQNNTKLIK